MQHGVIFDGFVETLVFFLAWQFAVEQEVAYFEEIGMFGELIDRVAPVQQYAVGAINVGNGGLAGCRGDKAWIVCENAFLDEAAYVDNVRADGAGINRKLNGLVSHRERGFPVGHGALLLI